MGRIIVVTAPSGTGKTTIIKDYRNKHNTALFSVSHTTRAKRDGEKDGVDYYFIDKDMFLEMIKSNKFVEWADVHGNYYGTSIDELSKAEKGDLLILDVDVQGALALKNLNVDALYVFIKPPSIDVLKERLMQRKTETEDTIKLRVWNAKREMEYENIFDFVIINEDIIKAEKDFEYAINNCNEIKEKKNIKGDSFK